MVYDMGVHIRNKDSNKNWLLLWPDYQDSQVIWKLLLSEPLKLMNLWLFSKFWQDITTWKQGVFNISHEEDGTYLENFLQKKLPYV